MPLQSKRAVARSSQSTTRSRCATSRPRRKNSKNAAFRSHGEPQVKEEPRTSGASTALESNGTPGSCLHVSGPLEVFQISRCKLPQKETLQQSIHTAIPERTAGMDLEEQEGEEATESNLGNIQKWLNELQVPESANPAPYLCITLLVPPEATTDSDSCVTSVQPVALAEPSCAIQGQVVVANGDMDPRPSTSGMVYKSRGAAQIDNEGSEFDSDFDDEFNIVEFSAFSGAAQDIPDEGLDEYELSLLSSITTAIDECVDRLVDVSTDFTWQSNFDTFRGQPEVFTGPTPGPINDYDMPYEAFTSIWSKDFMEHIVRETNRYAKQTIEAEKAAGTLKATSRLHGWTDATVDEMYVFFALYIYMGLDMRTSQQEYWKTTGYLQLPKFRQLMSFNRYILLNKFIHFADNSDVSQNLSQNGSVQLSPKLAKIAPVLNHLNSKFSKLYNLQKDIAIDESLTLFKGRLSWVQAIKSKAARLGIKSYELCESKTGYLWKFDIYTGKSSDGGDWLAPSVDLAGKSTRVVLDLLKGLEHRGHLVTMDNFYNRPSLSRYLKSLGFDSLGTLNPNCKHLPEEIAQVPKNVPKGTIIARHSGDLTCLAWKDHRMVYMISTYHTDETYVSKRFERFLVKPVAVRDYNKTMGGVDLKDQKLSMFLMERKRCVKWYMKLFKRLLNASVLNAFIMLSESLNRRGKPSMSHRDFREQLADSLVKEHHYNRLSPQENPSTSSEDMRLYRQILHIPLVSRGPAKKSCCHICLRNGKRKKVNLKCVTCDEYMCSGTCWQIWHSARELPGKNVITRKYRRRQQ